MHRIACPFCGLRDESEFQYQGDATVSRPSIAAEGEGEAETAALFAYVYMRLNPKGRHLELWHHAGGCRQYLKVERDTRTHEIFSVALVSGRGAGEAS